MVRPDRPRLLGDGERQFLARSEEERPDRPKILPSTQDRRARRAEDMARKATGHLEKLPDQMASGTETFDVTDGGESAAVTFPRNRFKVPPRVTVTADNGQVVAWVTAKTASGCTLNARRIDGTASIEVDFDWIAVSAPATE